MSEIHKRVSFAEIPKGDDGKLLVDVYVLLPSAKRYIVFVAKGDVFTDERKEKLKGHALPDLFVLPSDLSQAVLEKRGKIEIPEGFKSEVIGKEADKKLNAIYSILLDEDKDSDPKDPKETMDRLESTTDQILAVIAPESRNIKSILIENTKNVHLMNDASAIVSLAVLFAYANGFDSKKSYTELTHAALVMDSSLSKLTDAQRMQMYIDPDALDNEVKELIHKHPVKSHQLVTEKIPNLSEITMQLILNHHELFNGKGYPRGVRSESLFPMVRVLALAVDCFSILKRAELLGEEKNLEDAIFQLHEEDVEAHLRRHNKTISKKVVEFLDKASQAA